MSVAISAPSKGPSGAWAWQVGGDRYEVMLHLGSLYWSWEGPKDQGGGAHQSYDAFFADGPLDRDVPDGVLAAIRATLAASGIGPDAVSAPERKPPRPAPVPPPPVAPIAAPAERPAPDPARIIGAGVAIILGGTLLAGLLAHLIPFWGGFAAALPLLAGFAALMLVPSRLMVVAGLFGLGAAIVSVTSLPHYLSAVALEAPDFSRDLRVRTDLAATHDFITTRQSGASRVQQTNRAHAAPFAIANWSTRQPVSLWIVCSTTPGFDCLPSPTAQLSYIRPVRAEEAGAYRNAIRAAFVTHRLVPVERLRIYEVAEPKSALRLAIAAPLIAAGLFVGLAVFIGRRRTRAS